DRRDRIRPPGVRPLVSAAVARGRADRGRAEAEGRRTADPDRTLARGICVRRRRDARPLRYRRGAGRANPDPWGRVMFGTKDPADRYQDAAKALTKAEAAHRKNLDLLRAAREARQAHQVTLLRRDCEKSEVALKDALHEAHQAHRAYW